MTLRTALRALERNKLRSALTMLGVVIGVAAVIVMVSIGQGATAAVQSQIRSLGTNLLMVIPGATTRGGVRSGWGGASTLTLADAQAIGEELGPGARIAWIRRDVAQVVSGDSNWSTALQGTSAGYADVREWPLASGTFFGEREEASAARVAVLGRTVVDNLFGAGTDPIGQTVRIRNAPYTVVGVLERKGQSGMGQDQDDAIFVPVSSFQARMQGGLGKFIPGQIFVSAVSPAAIPAAEREIEALLRERHRLGEDEENDFSVQSIAEMTNTLSATTQTLSTLLASIALVSLIVGGIGVMNIMLVSVTERTREIGIRMAVGAHPSDILAQFLTEALALAAIGGLVGVLLGIGAGQLLSARFGWSMTVRTDIVVIALLVSALVGVIFGLYPARKAARLDPIDALRYE
jgi:putative ABC transport system permease protein